MTQRVKTSWHNFDFDILIPSPREDTPEDLVKIDFYTGQISVDRDQAIDADVPPREHLYYTIVASDRCYAEDPADCPPDPTYWETPGNVS